MSGNSKSSSLSFSSLARVLPRSAPSTPPNGDSKKSEVKDYFSLRRRSRVGSIPSVLEDKDRNNDKEGEKKEEEKKKEREKEKEGRKSQGPQGPDHKAMPRPKSSMPAPPPLIMSPSSTISSSTSNGTPKVMSPTITSNKRRSITASVPSRHGSVSSLCFHTPADAALPQGEWKGKNGRIRESSPPPQRFRSHVAFDSVSAGDATKNNTASVVLNCKHQGYYPSRRSRTFMVGLDDNSYSDYALEYLLSRLVDDGDHVVCVTVMEKEVRSIETSYREQARALMKKILKKNYDFSDCAIEVTLEYAVGKLHNTFQRLIQIYQPGMLIVGTRGRSGGFQGLMGSRNSFSKYCLQYSPIPVVVVRPDEQRAKKKNKRKLDPNRGSYARILARSTGGTHEADSNVVSSVYELESKLSKYEEAHKVAQAIGLPGTFDPTLKPLDLDKIITHRPSSQVYNAGASSLAPPGQPVQSTSDADDVSGEEEEDDEEGEAEFEVEAVHVTKQQKERLHMMEVGEAAALLKHEDNSEDEDDEDDNSNKKLNGGGAKDRDSQSFHEGCDQKA